MRGRPRGRPFKKGNPGGPGRPKKVKAGQTPDEAYIDLESLGGTPSFVKRLLKEFEKEPDLEAYCLRAAQEEQEQKRGYRGEGYQPSEEEDFTGRSPREEPPQT